MRNLCCFLLALCLCLASMTVCSAETLSGGFGYTLTPDGEAEITSYSGAQSAVAVPNQLDGHKVVSIGKEVFKGLPVSIVYLPLGVTQIGEGAFRDCEALMSVVMPASLTSVGKSAFRDCVALKTLIFPANVTEIGSGACFGCKSLNNVTLPRSLTELPGNMFNGCELLSTVILPENLEVVGSTAFMNCTGLKNVTLPETLTEIRASAFSGCEELETLELPVSLASIGYGAFDSPKLVLSVEKGSYAEEFCKLSKYDYVYTEHTESDK